MDLYTLLLLALTAVVIVVVKALFSRSEAVPKAPETNSPSRSVSVPTAPVEAPTHRAVLQIVYATQKGTTRRFAQQLAEEARKFPDLKVDVLNVNSFEVDELHTKKFVVFIVSTYTDGTPPDDGKAFYELLQDMSQDHRVPKTFLEDVKYAIFGCGNKLYVNNFNKFARDLDEFLSSRSAKRMVPIGMGDYDSGEMEEQFKTWSNGFARSFKRLLAQLEKKQAAELKEQLRAHAAREEEDSASDQEGSNEMVEVEDMGKMMDGQGSEEEECDEVELHRLESGEIDLEALTKPMVHPTMHKALSKQGYQLIGTHSGVKLCRWTKAMLRGRGGCYKHTFYGISSFQCMEMTPSLACANKCVFCWRHHTNPVAKEWKWKVDKAEFLVEGAMENHVKMIKSLRGVPGVQPERFQEAQNIQHCALSLVGEPILYPHINDLLDILHKKKISTFMVTNAQFPDKLDKLCNVTQLYLSIDAATKETLKAIDRPLFSDFWERFLDSIVSLRKKGQRTVFRLTLVKDYNMDDMSNYADLVKLGVPDFIEVKGVTYCGTSEASPLTIKNTPFQKEVLDFCQRLCDVVNSVVSPEDAVYEISCEHEHSLCVLITNKNKFFKNGKWHTWIDYPKFFELESSGQPYTAEDYSAQTPDWAVWGSPEKGFDPAEVRHMRNKTAKTPTQGC
eukprot:TRINITY_DN15390_c0_g1_i1.p1 TRINITY_DN15390_c0_g1~~TRINITY_DN15390_c0_g1_i1.p1  ORF type:complete len:687 (-),score=176.60 TRINITY_DN15390_c0_g1_i1:106-2127(-)